MSRLKPYGVGDEVVVVVVLVPVVSVLLSAAGDSFTIVVLFSVLLSAGGLVTVVSFFSQAGISAARAKRQIYFFIGWLDVKLAAFLNEITAWPRAIPPGSSWW
jgi:uncharacterized membrane protein